MPCDQAEKGGGEAHDPTGGIRFDNLSHRLWAFSPEHGEPVRVLEVESVWDHIVCQVWLAGNGTVERLTVRSVTAQGPPRKSGISGGALHRVVG